MLRKTAESLRVGDVLECLESCRIPYSGDYLAGDRVKVASVYDGSYRLESVNADGQYHFWHNVSIDPLLSRVSLPNRVIKYCTWYSLFKKVKQRAE